MCVFDLKLSGFRKQNILSSRSKVRRRVIVVCAEMDVEKWWRVFEALELQGKHHLSYFY